MVFLFRIFKFFMKAPSSGKFCSQNFFSILKHALKAVGGVDDELENFRKVSRNKKLQNQFSKFVYGSYCHNLSAARCRDAKIIMRNGRNFRADLIFYSVVFSFIVSIIVIIFFKHKLTPDSLSFFSIIAGVSSGCLKEIFGFEFGCASLTYKSQKYYLLDISDKPE